MDNAKHQLEIKVTDKPLRVSKEKTAALKGVVSGRMVNRMKKETVECPVMKVSVSFIECFSCKNFLRRVRGYVDCTGEPLLQP